MKVGDGSIQDVVHKRGEVGCRDKVRGSPSADKLYKAGERRDRL